MTGVQTCALPILAESRIPQELFVVAKTAQLVEGRIEYGETDIFVGPRHLITVRHGSARAHTELREHLEATPRLLAHGEINGTNFVSFILFSIFVGASLGSFPEIISQFQQTAGATERLRELLELAPERTDGDPDAKLAGAVTFENLSFRYPARPEALVLSDLSFHIEPGQRVALVGPSGAGKSTVFSLILGFNQPESGQILFDGHPVGSLALGALRSQIAIVPQEVLLFGGSIRENIEYGKPGASLEEIHAAARLANASDYIHALPEGFETMVGPRGTKLSGGQRQRIAIARAILADPRILLLDEATSALDSESERLVNEALERLMAGRTSLVIAHRLSTVRHAHRIHVMEAGQVVEAGRYYGKPEAWSDPVRKLLRYVPIDDALCRHAVTYAGHVAKGTQGSVGDPNLTLVQAMRRLRYVMERFGITKRDLHVVQREVRLHARDDVREADAGRQAALGQQLGKCITEKLGGNGRRDGDGSDRPDRGVRRPHRRRRRGPRQHQRHLRQPHPHLPRPAARPPAPAAAAARPPPGPSRGRCGAP